jgi:hypothetical protein
MAISIPVGYCFCNFSKWIRRRDVWRRLPGKSCGNMGPCMAQKIVTCLHVGRGAHNLMYTVHGSGRKQGNSAVTVTTNLTNGLMVVTNRVRQERKTHAIKGKGGN